MLKNFFTIAFRNCWRNRTTSLIHVLGLALGIATFLFGRWISAERHPMVTS